jgi:hypothetical protein
VCGNDSAEGGGECVEATKAWEEAVGRSGAVRVQARAANGKPHLSAWPGDGIRKENYIKKQGNNGNDHKKIILRNKGITITIIKKLY